MRNLLRSVAIMVSFFMLATPASAALTKSPTNLQADDVGVLRTGLSAAATSLTIEPIRKYVNAVRTTGCFDTGSGFLLIEDGTGRKEWASFDGKSCSASFVTNLSNLRRGLSPTTASYTAGTGMAWDAGSRVKVVDYPILYNKTLKLDVPNILTGSGKILSYQTNQAAFRPNSVTTAQRDAFTWVEDGDMIYNTTIGAHQLRQTGQWVNTTGSGVINSTHTVSGKSQLATRSDIRNLTGTGSQGPLVPWVLDMVKNGTGSLSAGRIVVTDHNGAISASLGGHGSGTYAASGILLTNGKLPMTRVAPGASNNVLKSNGEEWTSGAVPAGLSSSGLIITILNSSGAGVSSNAEKKMNQTGAIKAGSLTAGSVIRWSVSGTGTSVSTPAVTMAIRLGENVICSLADAAGQNTFNWGMHGEIIFKTVGAAATGNHWCHGRIDTTDGASFGQISTATDTTVRMDFEPTVTFGASNAGNAASFNMTVIDKLTRDG